MQFHVEVPALAGLDAVSAILCAACLVPVHLNCNCCRFLLWVSFGLWRMSSICCCVCCSVCCSFCCCFCCCFCRRAADAISCGGACSASSGCCFCISMCCLSCSCALKLQLVPVPALGFGAGFWCMSSICCCVCCSFCCFFC